MIFCSIFRSSKFVADFQLPGGTVVLVISENEYINASTKYQQRLVKFYKAYKGRPTIILCVRSKESSEDFAALQDICVLEFGLSLIPVDNLEQIPQVVQQLILVRHVVIESLMFFSYFKLCFRLNPTAKKSTLLSLAELSSHLWTSV